MSDDKRINVTSFNQSGGITAHTVNIGPPQRSLAQEAGLRAQIFNEVPRDKPIQVFAIMGDSESYRFAAEIHAFLKANGFPLLEPEGISQGLFAPPPVGLQCNDRGDHQEFIVGSAR